MNDEQFDDMARGALALEAGPPNESTWNRIKAVRWTWLPTVREILVCGCVSALALAAVGLGTSRNQESASEHNTVIQSALHDEPRSILASVTRIADTHQWGEWSMTRSVPIRGSSDPSPK